MQHYTFYVGANQGFDLIEIKKDLKEFKQIRYTTHISGE